MKVSIQIRGADGARDRLLELDERVNRRPARPLLQALGQEMASKFQANIRSGGSRLADRGVSWPQVHQVTAKIRDFYGHGASDPRLIRGGELLHSLGPLALGEDFVEVGSQLAYAAIVHRGGTWTDPKTGAARQVQAFPFVLPALQDLDDWADLVGDFFLGEGDA